MNETTGEIESHIRDTRADLNANLNELEQKVKSVADWRKHYNKAPGAFLATALGSGVLLALATKSNRPRSTTPPPAAPSISAPRQPREKGALEEPLSVIKAALIGMAANHAKEMLAKLLPGFESQLSEQKRPRPERSTARARQDDGSTGIG
jgi:hypothetical protein